MTSRGTTRRSVRISDQLWRDAQEAAERRGEDVAVVIRRCLTRYVARDRRDRRERESSRDPSHG